MARIDFSGLSAKAETVGEPAAAPLSAFEEDPNQPRTEFEGPAFDELVDDIRQRGILQPLVVVKGPSGKLLIRFGARRFRAAKKLELRSVPYVLATDPRHLDDYAQVSENEKRANLQPLELALFIRRKVDQGEAKQDVGAKVGISSSTITYLLSLIDAPPVLAEAYETHKCRSPRYLYQLRALHDKNPKLVESRVRDAKEIDAAFVATLTDELKGEGPVDAAKAQPRQPALPRVREEPQERKSPAREVASPKGEAKARRAALVNPVLRAMYRRKPVTLMLDVRPSKAGSVYVKRDKDGVEEEVAFANLAHLVLGDAD